VRVEAGALIIAGHACQARFEGRPTPTAAAQLPAVPPSFGVAPTEGMRLSAQFAGKLFGSSFAVVEVSANLRA
jgi:hypothetical protein